MKRRSADAFGKLVAFSREQPPARWLSSELECEIQRENQFAKGKMEAGQTASAGPASVREISGIAAIASKANFARKPPGGVLRSGVDALEQNGG